MVEMNNKEAMQALINGKKIRHSSFRKDEWIAFADDNDSFINQDGEKVLPMLVGPWQIYKKLQPPNGLLPGFNCPEEPST